MNMKNMENKILKKFILMMEIPIFWKEIEIITQHLKKMEIKI